MNRLVVLSGCSSGGKSTLLSELEHRGYTVVHEVGREIVKEQLSVDSGITPWQKPKEFCELLISRSIEVYRTAKKLPAAKAHVIFFDRSFLEGVAYYQSQKMDDSHKYDRIVDELRFDPTIFMVPPWAELFCHDKERQHSFEDAVAEYERLLEFYPRHGYSILEIPKASIKERVEWLLKQVFSNGNAKD
jgi:predicted ATPase